ncbi:MULTISPECIES: alpha/beta fold hydrolase [Thioclava]|uniref:Alpha/beta hydrolase n=1 Tax=Thioclava nitratireducens TaxID=1915078 RepID=A0ABM6IHZ2_9RHOB|nr:MULTISPECIES: alpha/beta hydrolase [Thioclava]AQS48490.1 alpha/beta hydrolase [Thioclava nitratireducens]OWY06390.1 alpha/beta hydrolase [Thioclava sp. IC9]OWY07987.1 alpha/beta hydrolase [Thioclava sp. F42-5]OWY18706.1 alpha/beta hydrolase [Thioclava sp. JM3]WGT49872.1 alpha/beta hydrolase [Thioclava nitratireducens]
MTAAPLGPGQLNAIDHGGSGRPVVLIHGWPLSGKAWERQVPALLDAGHRVITYDRRGFGLAEKPTEGFDYDTLAADLDALITAMDLHDVTLVGFSMGGGEVARYIRNHGEGRLRAAVFASAVTPYLMQSDDNPDGPLTKEAAEEMEQGLRDGRETFFPQFVETFYSAGGELKASDEDCEKAVTLCNQSDQSAALGCMEAFGTTDFRADLEAVRVPVLVIHGDSDEIVPLEGSAARTYKAIPDSQFFTIKGAPHGCNVTHSEEFNIALMEFLK